MPQTNIDADREAAAGVLAQAGITDTDGDGILDYDNGTGARVPFQTTILVNHENTFKVAAAQQIADALTAVGIPTTVDAVAFEDYTARLASGMFEIYYGETRMSPDFDLR